MTSTEAKWGKAGEGRVREFLPYGNAKRVRFSLIDSDGKVVDRCGVTNVPEDIEATFRTLVGLHGGGEFTYEITDL